MTDSRNPNPVQPVPAGYRYRRRSALTARDFLRVAAAIRLAPEGHVEIRNDHGQVPCIKEWKGRDVVWLTFHCRTHAAATFLKFLVGGDDIGPVRRSSTKPVIRIMATAVVRPDPRGPIVY